MTIEKSKQDVFSEWLNKPEPEEPSQTNSKRNFHALLRADPFRGRKSDKPSFILAEFDHAIADLKNLPACAMGNFKLGWDSSRSQVGCTTCNAWVYRPLRSERDDPEGFNNQMESQRASLARQIDAIVNSYTGEEFTLNLGLIETCGGNYPNDHPFWEILNKLRPLFDSICALNEKCTEGKHKPLVTARRDDGSQVDVLCGDCRWTLITLSGDEWGAVHRGVKFDQLAKRCLNLVAACLAQIASWGGSPTSEMVARFREFVEVQTPLDQESIYSFLHSAFRFNRRLVSRESLASTSQSRLSHIQDLFPNSPVREVPQDQARLIAGKSETSQQMTRLDLLYSWLEISRLTSPEEPNEFKSLGDAWSQTKASLIEQQKEIVRTLEKHVHGWIKSE